MSVLVNASLLEIAQPGPPARNGDPGPGIVVWRGRADGYLARRRRQVTVGRGTGDGRIEQSIRDAQDVFVMLRAGAAVLPVAGPDWEASIVVIEDRRSEPVAQRRFTVVGMQHRAVGSPADSIRLELDDLGAAA